jgi:demethylsterigmatocystin 6-O-methyltransferase
LAETNYRDITDKNHTPFQKAYDTNLHPFEWFAQNPKRFEHFHEGMAAMASAAWIDVVEVFQRAAKQTPHTIPRTQEIPFFVDVGGGYGHQSVLLGKRYPNLLHQIVLQDLPQTLEHVSMTEGIEAQAHDFFTPQPIKGELSIIFINLSSFLSSL